MECYICHKTLDQASKCILCEEYVCQEHSRSYEVGHERSEGSERKIHAYICDRCIEAVEELKRKPREEWSDEDKAKSKGMIGKILHALGVVGMTIILAIFTFALWILAKGDEEGDEPGTSSMIDGDAKSGWDFPSESMGEGSFTEETTFEEDESATAM